MNSNRPHLLRRLAAILYDSLLLCAVWFIAGLPLPLIPEHLRDNLWVRYAILIYILFITFAFFGWFWTHGGQTLGMRAWRIRLINEKDAKPISWKNAWQRFYWALVSWVVIGIGFLWSLIHHERSTWHDLMSNTYLAMVIKKSDTPKQN